MAKIIRIVDCKSSDVPTQEKAQNVPEKKEKEKKYLPRRYRRILLSVIGFLILALVAYIYWETKGYLGRYVW